MYNKTLAARNRGTRTGNVEFIVLHDTAGSGTQADAEYLAHDPEHRNISVDFCVLKDGTVYQLNNDLKGHCTYHAGRHTSFRGRVNGAVNQHSIGIEISQKVNMQGLAPAYPTEQVLAVAALCVDLCQQFKLTKLDITTHQHIITDGSRTDPRQFPWDQFWTYFNRSLMSGDVAPDIQGQQIIHNVVEGDTLYGLANTYHTSVEAIKALNNMNTASNVITVGQKLVVHR